MSDASSDPIPRGIATLRIIAFALAAGVTLFLIVAAFVAPVGGPGMERQRGLFVSVSFILAVAHVVGYVLVRRSILSRAAMLPDPRESSAQTAWLQSYQGLTLIGCALAEGAALVAIVFYLLTAEPMLTVVPVLGILAIALQFPSADRFESFAAAALAARR